jgi:hypothetical protein
MTTRTFQFYGRGYSEGAFPVSITVTFNDIVIYDGEIPTLEYAPINYSTDPVLLFTGGEVPVDFSGTVPMTITLHNGARALIGTVYSNYVQIPNPVFTPEQYATITSPAGTRNDEKLGIYTSLANPPMTQEDIDLLTNQSAPAMEIKTMLATHGILPLVSGGADHWDTSFFTSDCRTDITINQVPQSVTDFRSEDKSGHWNWVIDAGDVMTYNLNVQAGQE